MFLRSRFNTTGFNRSAVETATFTGSATLGISKSLKSETIYTHPVYRGQAVLTKNVRMTSMVNQGFPIYRGSAKLQTSSVRLNVDIFSLAPRFTGLANLSISPIKLNSLHRSIIDDSDTSVVSSNFEWELSINKGYNNTNYRFFFPGFGASTYWWQWHHNNLVVDNYDVYATWVSHPNRASNTKYEIISSGQPTKTVYVNQKLFPNGPIFGGVPFQKLGSIRTTNGSIIVRVYAHESEYVVADATMVTNPYQFKVPVYTGGGNLYKPTNMLGYGTQTPPVFVGSSKLTIKDFDLISGVTSRIPTYTGLADLIKNPVIDGLGANVVPMYTGTMRASIPVILTSNFENHIPVYNGVAILGIKQVQVIASGLHSLPNYVGSSALSIKPVLVAYGDNVFEGFVHSDVLYITNKFVAKNYIKLAMNEVRVL